MSLVTIATPADTDLISQFVVNHSKSLNNGHRKQILLQSASTSLRSMMLRCGGSVGSSLSRRIRILVVAMFSSSRDDTCSLSASHICLRNYRQQQNIRNTTTASPGQSKLGRCSVSYDNDDIW